MSTDLQERIKARATVDANGCWIWQRSVGQQGYGSIKVPGVPTRYAHRVAYQAWHGPIPPALQLDHLCRIRRCVNPAHLEPVTQRTNILRGEAPTAVNARKDRCKRNHPFDSANTYIPKRGRPRRECRACRRAAERRRLARLRGQEAS